MYGYVLLPPSIGINGRRYEPDERAPIAPMPAWLLERLTDTANGGHTAAPAAEWVPMVRNGLQAGERNNSITRLVGHMLRRYIDVDLAAELVHLVNQHHCNPPLSDAEVDRIVDSVAGRVLRRRRQRSKVEA